MLKLERRLLEFAEKHMLLLSALFLSLLALYLRKTAVWWNYENIVSYFDLHENHTQTAAYYLLVRLVQFLPLLPVHSIKWLAGISDFGVAGLVVYLLGKEVHGGKRLIFYVVCLFSPVLFLRGIIWAQLDSLAVGLLLLGYILHSRRQKNKRAISLPALVTVIAAIALCPYLYLAMFFYLWQVEERKQVFWTCVAAVTAGSLLVQSACAMLIGEALIDGLYSGIRFLTYHPESGILYDNGTEWVLQMVYLYSPVAAVSTILAAGKHRLSYNWTIVIQIVGTLLYGSVLFE